MSPLHGSRTLRCFFGAATVLAATALAGCGSSGGGAGGEWDDGATQLVTDMRTALGNIGALESNLSEFDALIAQDPAAVNRFAEQEAVLAECTPQLDALGSAPTERSALAARLSEMCSGFETATTDMKAAVAHSNYAEMSAALHELAAPLRILKDAESELGA